MINLASGDGDNQAILEDDADETNNTSQIRSGNGTFETTTFSNPTTSLTINAGGDGETVTIARPDPSLPGPINVNAGAGQEDAPPRLHGRASTSSRAAASTSAAAATTG